MEAKLIHCGQYERYGDFFRVWKIKTDGESKEEVLKYIRENVHKYDLPPAGEWAVNVRYGGEKYNDPAYYFRGYYTLDKIKGGYRYTVREPYYLWKTRELCGDL